MASDGGLVCVTGGSGFVGSWLVRLLLGRGYTVHATVKNLQDEGETKHLQALDGADKRLRLFQMDLVDPATVRPAVEGARGVFHLASPVPLHPSEDPENELLEPALKGTLNVLRAAKDCGVNRVVMVSSQAAMVPNPNWPADKVVGDDSWADVELLKDLELWYNVSKTVAEKAAWDFAEKEGLGLVVLNPALVLGPTLTPSITASLHLLLLILKGQSFTTITILQLYTPSGFQKLDVLAICVSFLLLDVLTASRRFIALWTKLPRIALNQRPIGFRRSRCKSFHSRDTASACCSTPFAALGRRDVLRRRAVLQRPDPTRPPRHGAAPATAALAAEADEDVADGEVAAADERGNPSPPTAPSPTAVAAPKSSPSPSPSPAPARGRGAAATGRSSLYEARRAEAEEMRRRTYLPVLLFGCIGLGSRGLVRGKETQQ